MRIIIVDKNDKVIGFKERSEIALNDIYRVSALWIQNSNGEILLAQRSFTKKNNPGKWGPAVSGTVDEEESYEDNIMKEAEEEIGLKNHTFKKVKYGFHPGKHKYFSQWFFAIVDKDINEFRIQKEEVAQIKWFKKDELLEELNKSPERFLDHIKDHVKYFSRMKL